MLFIIYEEVFNRLEINIFFVVIKMWYYDVENFEVVFYGM